MGVELAGERAELLGLELLEGEVLELPLDLPDAEALGQRGVDLHRLAGDTGPLLGRQRGQRTHVVEPIGQLDEDDPDVLGHGQEHLADVLGLLLLMRQGRELGELRHPVDESRDLRAEALLEVCQGEAGVLGDVVQEGALDRHRVDAELGEDLGDRDRMCDVGLPGGTQLFAMGFLGELESAAHRGQIGLRVVLRDAGLETAQEGRKAA